MMNDQAAKLRRQMELTGQKRNAKTICIVSGKGGVGKSNFAINFSLELINQGKRVLIFDLDLGMGNIDVLLGVHPKRTILDMFNHQLSIHDIIEVDARNLAYIAGGSGLNELFFMDKEKQDYFLEAYHELIDYYDYIIFDMGAGIHTDSMFFVLAADECIVITTPEPTSITDAYSMIKQMTYNGANMPIYVIMNRVASQKSGEKSMKQFEQVVKRFLHIDVHSLGILPEDKVVTQSVYKQVPFVILFEKSTIAKALRQIAYNYITNSEELNKIQSTSFIQRLKRLFTEV